MSRRFEDALVRKEPRGRAPHFSKRPDTHCASRRARPAPSRRRSRRGRPGGRPRFATRSLPRRRCRVESRRGHPLLLAGAGAAVSTSSGVLPSDRRVSGSTGRWQRRRGRAYPTTRRPWPPRSVSSDMMTSRNFLSHEKPRLFCLTDTGARRFATLLGALSARQGEATYATRLVSRGGCPSPRWASSTRSGRQPALRSFRGKEEGCSRRRARSCSWPTCCRPSASSGARRGRAAHGRGDFVAS